MQRIERRQQAGIRIRVRQIILPEDRPRRSAQRRQHVADNCPAQAEAQKILQASGRALGLKYDRRQENIHQQVPHPVKEIDAVQPVRVGENEIEILMRQPAAMHKLLDGDEQEIMPVRRQFQSDQRFHRTEDSDYRIDTQETNAHT